jgi:hypothetical protein
VSVPRATNNWYPATFFFCKCHYYFQFVEYYFSELGIVYIYLNLVVVLWFDLVYVIESGGVRFIRLQVTRDGAELLLNYDETVDAINVLACDFGALLLQNVKYCRILEGYRDP